jgi:nicotinamide mononucleotide (NMN) deamidase PncC
MLPTRLSNAAVDVATLIAGLHLKLVLAESCTAGLAAAALGQIPGGSSWMCGSAVVYRTETKVAWLDVDPPHFHPPEPDSVGPQTADALARALLVKTPEAQVAAAIVGHLGPDAPPELDGRIFVRVLIREETARDFDAADVEFDERLPTVRPDDNLEFRKRRQADAASAFLEQIAGLLKHLARHDDGTNRQKQPIP